MKHIKLFENYESAYYSDSDIAKLKEFAATVSKEINDENEDEFDRKSSGIDANDYTPEAMFKYISMWGEDNEMAAADVIEEFKWRELSQELGLG